MNSKMVLDVDNVARIGLMYLNGDLVENVMLDKLSLDYDDVTYNHEYFKELKIALTRMERINPDLDVTAVLWQLRPDNDKLAVPIICGNAFPEEGWEITPVNPEMDHVFRTGESSVKKRSETCSSHYYAVRNSDNEIVAVLELLVGRGYRKDI